MRRFLYLSHPEVVIDPLVSVPDWGLNARGAARVTDWVDRGCFDGVGCVVSSAERKAVETADPVASSLGLTPEIRPNTHENDRSATGYLLEPDFERTADAFFATPTESVRGWERAADAQARIVADTADLPFRSGTGDILLVGHGGVGTLLWCHFAGEQISRSHDQAQAGSVWAMSLPECRMLHAWTAAEDLYN